MARRRLQGKNGVANIVAVVDGAAAADTAIAAEVEVAVLAIK